MLVLVDPEMPGDEPDPNGCDRLPEVGYYSAIQEEGGPTAAAPTHPPPTTVVMAMDAGIPFFRNDLHVIFIWF